MSKQTVMTITRGVLLYTPPIWIIWDIIAFKLGGNPWTESSNIFVYSLRFPSIPLGWGYLTGHFFAQNRFPSTESLGQPFFKSFKADMALVLNLAWLTWDLIKQPSPLTAWLATTPGPGHGSIEMVIFGTMIGYWVFQMNDDTLPS